MQHTSNKEQPFQQYFHQASQRHYSISAIQITDNMNNQLYQQINNGEIKLPSKLGAKHLQLKQPQLKQKQIQTQNQTEKLKKVEGEIQDYLMKVKVLEDQEFSIKYKKNTNHKKYNSQFKSQLTQSDRTKLRELVKNSRIYERSLANKNKQIKILLREKSMQELKKHEQHCQTMRKQHKNKVISSLKSLQLKSTQRQKNHQRSQEAVQNIINSKYLYEKYLEKEEEKKYQEATSYQNKINQMKEQMRFDIREIQEHQKKYSERLSELKEKMGSRVLQNHKSKSYAENHFRSLVLEKIEQQKINEENRNNRGHQMKQKICKYLDQVNLKHAPKISKNSRFILPRSQSQSVHIMNNIQQRNQGLQYLEKAKKLKDKQKQGRKNQVEKREQYRYIDYSKNLKVKHYQTTETQFNSIIKKGKAIQGIDLTKKALILAEKMDAKSKKSKDYLLVDSVKNKMKIFEALEKN